MREPRKIVGRRLVRREGESYAEYLVAAEHHLRTLRWGRASLLRIAMARVIESIEIDEDISLDALTDVARAVLEVLDEFRYGEPAAIKALKAEIINSHADSALTVADVVVDTPESLLSLQALEEFGLQTDGLAAKFPDSRPEIVRRPGVSGDWVIWGTSIPAKTVETEISAGRTEEEIIASYPTLPPGVVEAVRRWRLHVDLITAVDVGAREVLDYELVERSTSGPPAIVYLAPDKIGVHGDFVVSVGDLDLPDLVVSSGRVGDLIDPYLRDQLEVILDILIARWERKKAIAGQDLSWDAWQARVSVNGGVAGDA